MGRRRLFRWPKSMTASQSHSRLIFSAKTKNKIKYLKDNN